MSGFSINNNINMSNTFVADNTRVNKISTDLSPKLDSNDFLQNKVEVNSDLSSKAEIERINTSDNHVIESKNSKNKVPMEVKLFHESDSKNEIHSNENHHGEEHSLIEDISHKAHKGHVGYECATIASKGVIIAGKSIQNLGRSLTIVSNIENTLESSKGVKVLTKTASHVKALHGFTATKSGAAILNMGHFFQEAHHATEATQKAILTTVSKGASSVGATKTATQISKLAKAGHSAHVAHGASEVAHITGATAKNAKFLGKVAPAIGFAAGMVGAGIAINDATHAKTKTTVAVHSVRAGLNVVSAGASLVPRYGAAVGLAATAADIGLGWVAKKMDECK